MDIINTNTITTRAERNYVIVRIETEDGLVGWGDATLNGREKAVEAALVEHILPDLNGHDPSRIEDVWQMFFRNTYWRGGPVLNTALSGVDMALWDLKGKKADLPVYDLLGGRTREYARVYQHCDATTLDRLVDNIETARDRGIDHYRINYRRDEGFDFDDFVVGADHVREELGPEPELLVEVHGRARPIEAARLAKRLEPHGLYFLEDPVRPENPDAFETVRRYSTTPLAMGELFSNPWEMLPLIERDLVDFVRADLAHVGGITPADKLAAVSEHHYTQTAFHAPGDISPIGQAATIHLDLSLPNFGVQELCEHHTDVGPEVAEVFDGGAFFLEGEGALDVPDEPGLGIDVDWEAAIERADEYEREHFGDLRHPDGSVRSF